MTNRFVIIVPKDSEINKIDDLAGKIVGIQEGGAIVPIFNAYPVSKDVQELRSLANNIEIMEQLKAGDIDAGVMDECVAKYFIAIKF